jgi:cytoskeletal protein RodZ
MSTVAEQLRQGREARNLTVEQVAEITKMRTDHVRAIEEGNYKAFSAPVYIRGFVRTYSRLLKLDEAALMAGLENEMGGTPEFGESAARQNQTKGILDLATLQLSKLDWRRSLAGVTAAVVIAAIVLGILAWRKSNSQDINSLRPGVYKPAREITETLPLGR